MTRTTRAAVYLRQSLDRTGDGDAIARQLEAIVRLCQARGWRIVETFTDNDTSASNGKARKDFERMMADVSTGAFDVIVCWHIDRLVRKLTELERVIAETTRWGITVATVNGELDLSNDTGRLLGRILASVAAGEVDRKSTRQKAAGAQKAARGLPSGGNRAFAYTPDGLELVEAEAEALRWAYAELLGGASLSSIAKGLNARGLATGQGRPWRHVSVRSVLLNSRNAGLRSYGGEVVAKAVWPGVVSEDVWRAAVSLIEAPERKTTTGPARRHLLTGIGRCGVCDAPVRVNYRDYRIYQCPARHVSRRADWVDEYVTGAIVGRLSAPDAARLLEDDDAPDAAVLRVEAAALATRLDELAGAFAAGAIVLSQLTTGTEMMKGRLAEINAALARPDRAPVLADLVRAADVAGVWDGLDLSRQRAVIKALVQVRILPTRAGRKAFDPAGVELVWD